jgi:methyl-accepting chemotaxis protein
LSYHHGPAANGTLSEAEARQQAMQAVKRMHHGGREYFWLDMTCNRAC